METTNSSSSEIFELNPAEVKVNEDLPRLRKDMRKVEKLAESFAKFGQMQPIVVNRNLELIAGGRRLAACLISARKVKCCYSDTVDPLTMREMELEENLQRENLTPAEECLGVDEIHRLKQQIHGTPFTKEGRNPEGWKLDDTAELIGKTRGNVIEAIDLANMIKMFPDLSKAKTKSEIRKAAKGLTAVSKRLDALADYEGLVKQSKSKAQVFLANALDHMESIPDNSIDLLVTDPPWGIDINLVSRGAGGRTGQDELNTTGFSYSDNKEESMALYASLAQQSFRFTRETSHAYVFVAPEHFWFIRTIWEAVGWQVHVRPIVWIKGTSGQNNVPSHWPSAAYEFIMYARRRNTKLVVEGRPDWIQFPTVLQSQRVHQAQKPVELIKDLLQRSGMPSEVVYDPFMGSGSTIIAALEMKMLPIGCDIAPESYSATLQRIVEYERSKK